MGHRFFIAAAAVCLFATNAHSQVTDGYTRAQFQAAVDGSPALQLQNFDSFAAGSTLTTDGSVNYSSSSGVPLITNSYLTTTTPNGLGRTGTGYFLAGDIATFTFLAPVTAFAIDINTFATDRGSYRVVLSNGGIGSSIFENFSSTSTGQFIGLTSSTAFTSVSLSSIGSFAYSLDTLIYGSSSPVINGSVPEIATWGMMIAGFGVMGAAMRTRRRSTKVSFA